MNTQLLEFIIDNEFETLQDAVSFYNTFGPQEIDDNIRAFKPYVQSLIVELSRRGQLDQALKIINKKCLYQNELAQYAKAVIHEIKFESFKQNLLTTDRDDEMAALIKLVG